MLSDHGSVIRNLNSFGFGWKGKPRCRVSKYDLLQSSEIEVRTLTATLWVLMLNES